MSRTRPRRNGNILFLNRWIDGDQKDGLSYSYYGNQLTKVTDSKGSEGFNNGSSGSDTDYGYDSNGNATSDKNRGIGDGGLKYNILNLPGEIAIGSYILKYHYDASGNKLRMENSNGTPNTKYAGIFEYNNQRYHTRIATDEGQVSITNNGANATDYSFEYYLRDHLGNTRMVINEAGTIVQETEYMPFGLAIPRSGTDAVNKYQYNGKEKQPETGYLDYGARQYDPTIGRWMVVDKLSNKYLMLSSYCFVANNPIRYIDPDGNKIVDAKGNQVTFTVNKEGGLTWSKNATTDIQRIGNALARTEEGMTQLNALQSAKHPIYMNIDSEKKAGQFGLTNKTVSWNSSDKTFKIDKVELTIYEVDIKEFSAEINKGMLPTSEQGKQYAQLANDLEGIIAADAGHEAVHSANYTNIKESIHNKKLGTKYDVEKKQEEIESRILQQLIDILKKIQEQKKEQ